tara:strand:+ start:3558 stop:5921 length:2364 start_codon:yes stop_codon:yes gene_type:complete
MERSKNKMAKKINKKAQKIKKLFELVNNANRTQWEYINQKGFDFAHDNQITESEKTMLEDQGMPTFTINRIMPVVEMLNFYATANKPRWQAVGVDGSDTDIAAVYADVADYIWDLSDGSTLYANAINDSITKSIGYLMVGVNKDSDQGMGDVSIHQPEPFDIYVDPKSRDMLFKDASFILCRKVLPKEHLKIKHPEYVRKITKANSDDNGDHNLSEKVKFGDQKDFGYKDIDESETGVLKTGERDELIEYYELYEKVKIKYMNVFYRKPLDKEKLNQLKKQAEVQITEMRKELEVQMIEKQMSIEQAVQSGQMIPERAQLELEKLKSQMEQQLSAAYQQLMSDLQNEASEVLNVIISEKEYKVLIGDKNFKDLIIDVVSFYDSRVQQTVCVGDAILYTEVFPEQVKDYPIVPFHFKWTGTPYPISAVSPLIGKQREINKSHQILVHNASLGSSLRWMHEEGSVDTDYWEKYSSSPGALLPIRPGAAPPTPVQPAPLNNAFFSLVQAGKGDMEYLAGIYSSMMGDTGKSSETYRGMLAMDEYGTRRVKQWLQNSIEPSLKQMGTLVQQFSQAVYTAHKVFRVVQPNALQESKQVEINVPMYNDLGEAIGKWKDYSAAKFDVRIVSGSTLPINRWAYLDELKELMQLGVIDDIALLSETDIRNKEKIAERKSQYAQMQGQLGSQEEQIKDLTGTIETLERQLVQAGIKSKVQDAEVEINKKKESVKSDIEKHRLQTEAEAKFAGKVIRDEVGTTKRIINEQKTNEMARMKLDLEQVLLEAKNNKEELAE